MSIPAGQLRHTITPYQRVTVTGPGTSKIDYQARKAFRAKVTNLGIVAGADSGEAGGKHRITVEARFFDIGEIAQLDHNGQRFDVLSAYFS